MKKLNFIQPIPRFDKAFEKITKKHKIAPHLIWKQLCILCEFPENGDKIPKSSGLRKFSTSVPPAILRNGLRFIYFVTTDSIIPLDIYCKADKKNLSPDDIRAINRELMEYLPKKK